MNWRAERIWEGETCAILAGGPSLRGLDAEALRGVRVLTINDSHRLAPWADLHYFCDQSWLAGQKGIDLDCGKWVKGGEARGVDERVKVLRFTGQLGFEADISALRHGSNSGYQALHLAAHLGAARILLLGYDMRCEGARSHWHNAARPRNFSQILKLSMLPLFDTLVDPLKKRGVRVINCTPNSSLRCWEYKPLEEALANPLLTAPSLAPPSTTRPLLA